MGWHVLAKTLQHCAACWPLSFGFKPTGSIHVPTVTDTSMRSLLDSSLRVKRGPGGAQSAGKPPWGPSVEEEGGANGAVYEPAQDWSEHKSQNTIFHVHY